MVHISTDAVFDGVKGNYSEEDAPNPVNVYAQTKLRGEQAVLAANPDAAGCPGQFLWLESDRHAQPG